MASPSLTINLLRWIIGLIFLFSGVTKLSDLDGFDAAINALQILPAAWEAPVAYFVPTLEFCCGLSLTLGWLQRGSLLLIQILLTVFTAILVSAWVRGLDVRCGCFGSWFDWGSYPWWIARNGVLLGAALILKLKLI